MSLKEQGNAAFKALDFESAVQYYSEALVEDPKNYAIYSNRSAAYLKIGKAAAALKDAEACITWKGDFTRGWLRKGQAHEAMDQWRDAVEAYRSGLDIDPTNDQLAGDRYVTVAWGRDYGDVPPLKGVIFTEAKRSTMRVAVDVAPLGD